MYTKLQVRCLIAWSVYWGCTRTKSVMMYFIELYSTTNSISLCATINCKSIKMTKAEKNSTLVFVVFILFDNKYFFVILPACYFIAISSQFNIQNFTRRKEKSFWKVIQFLGFNGCLDHLSHVFLFEVLFS